MIKSLFKPVGIGLLILAFCLVIWANRTGRFEPRTSGQKGTLLPVTSETTFPAQTIPITCGVNVLKTYDFAVQTETFSAEGWVWLIWPASFEKLRVAQNIPVDKILTPVNSTLASSISFTPDSSQTLPDGRTYQLYRFSGKFFAFGLDFRHFPFETIKLPIVFGLNPDNEFLSIAHARLVPDTAESGLGEFTDIPGYVNTGHQLQAWLYQFSAGFGLPLDHTTTESQFSRVQLDVIYHTSTTSAILQIVMPMFVVMTILLLAPNLAGSLWNVRIVIPTTILLALIFQAQAYRAKIPQLSYLTFMDQLYSCCFAVALVIFGLFVWSSNELDKASADNRPATVDRINRIDLRFQIWLSGALVVLVCLAWFFPGRLH